jgi:hypothetical protein
MPQISLSEDQLARVYVAIWQNIAREDGNVSSRIGWAIGLTSGQFGAISFMVVGINGHNDRLWPVLIATAISAISILGMFFCYRTKIGVEAAHEQIAYLRLKYNDHTEEFVAIGLPRPFGESKSAQPGRKSSQIFPVALLTFWTVIFVVSLGGTIWAIALAAAH